MEEDSIISASNQENVISRSLISFIEQHKAIPKWVAENLIKINQILNSKYRAHTVCVIVQQSLIDFLMNSYDENLQKIGREILFNGQSLEQNLQDLKLAVDNCIQQNKKIQDILLEPARKWWEALKEEERNKILELKEQTQQSQNDKDKSESNSFSIDMIFPSYFYDPTFNATYPLYNLYMMDFMQQLANSQIDFGSLSNVAVNIGQEAGHLLQGAVHGLSHAASHGLGEVAKLSGEAVVVSFALGAAGYGFYQIGSSFNNIAHEYKVPRSVFRIMNALGFGVAGAFIGASFGSIIPGVGNVVGAIIGAIIGLAIGLGFGSLVGKYLARYISTLFNSNEVNPTNPDKYRITEKERKNLIQNKKLTTKQIELANLALKVLHTRVHSPKFKENNKENINETLANIKSGKWIVDGVDEEKKFVMCHEAPFETQNNYIPAKIEYIYEQVRNGGGIPTLKNLLSQLNIKINTLGEGELKQRLSQLHQEMQNKVSSSEKLNRGQARAIVKQCCNTEKLIEDVTDINATSSSRIEAANNYYKASRSTHYIWKNFGKAVATVCLGVVGAALGATLGAAAGFLVGHFIGGTAGLYIGGIAGWKVGLAVGAALGLYEGTGISGYGFFKPSVEERTNKVIVDAASHYQPYAFA